MRIGGSSTTLVLSGRSPSSQVRQPPFVAESINSEFQQAVVQYTDAAQDSTRLKVKAWIKLQKVPRCNNAALCVIWSTVQLLPSQFFPKRVSS
jgi:hypothetical protein